MNAACHALSITVAPVGEDLKGCVARRFPQRLIQGVPSQVAFEPTGERRIPLLRRKRESPLFYFGRLSKVTIFGISRG